MPAAARVTNNSDQIRFPVQFLNLKIQFAISLCQLVRLSPQLFNGTVMTYRTSDLEIRSQRDVPDSDTPNRKARLLPITSRSAIASEIDRSVSNSDRELVRLIALIRVSNRP